MLQHALYRNIEALGKTVNCTELRRKNSGARPGIVLLTSAPVNSATLGSCVVQLHDRMPLVLKAAEWPTWLGEVKGDPQR